METDRSDLADLADLRLNQQFKKVYKVEQNRCIRYHLKRW